MFLSEALERKWAPILDHESLAGIKDPYRRAVTAVVLENQEKALKEERHALFEDAPINNIASTPGIDKYDPILISLVRRSLPNLMAYDVAGVQPMSGPTGLIFAMKSRYGGGSNRHNATEALFNEADTDFSGTGTHQGTDPIGAGYVGSQAYLTGAGMATAAAEALGTSGGGTFNEMSFTIEKTMVEAKSRALKAEYTVELAQDLKAVHGLEADSELSHILSQEILTEINREVIRTIYRVAKKGSLATATPGTFDLDVDSNGRWSVERFKGLMFNIERDANNIAQDTRRGRGNFLIVSADVASALAMAGVLDHTPALSANNGLSSDDTGNTFAGVLNGRFKVFIDPYSANFSTANQFYVVGYKGSSPYDAGIFYCPYVPLQMVRATDPGSFQPKIGFKTRYGMIANPFVLKADGSTDGATFTPDRNHYFRKTLVQNLM